jgi:hypothetical protein
VVLRCGDEVLFAEVVEDAIATRDEYGLTPIEYAVSDASVDARCIGPDDDVPLAVEDVVAPNPHMGLTNVSALIETARLVGYLQALYPVVLVPPGGHGKAPLQTYPEALVGPRETAGTGRRRHLRSAWDVAGAAPGAARIAAAVQDATYPRPA